VGADSCGHDRGVPLTLMGHIEQRYLPVIAHVVHRQVNHGKAGRTAARAT
jgi:hypothetical protein